MRGHPEAEHVLTAAVAEAQRRFGRRLRASYAIGSLAHGGFAPLVSDVDIALVLGDPLLEGDEATVAGLTATIRASGGLAAHLSTFWTTAAVLRGEAQGGRLPAVDRLDLLAHGRLLAGVPSLEGARRPTPETLVLEGARFALDRLADDAPAAGATAPGALLAGGVRAVTKRALFPVRLLYTAAFAEIGRNEAAAFWYVQSARPHAELVAAALRWRADGLDATAPALLGAHLRPLYLEFVDDYRGRVDRLGRADLAGQLERWRDRLA